MHLTCDSPVAVHLCDQRQSGAGLQTPDGGKGQNESSSNLVSALTIRPAAAANEEGSSQRGRSQSQRSGVEGSAPMVPLEKNLPSRTLLSSARTRRAQQLQPGPPRHHELRVGGQSDSTVA